MIKDLEIISEYALNPIIRIFIRKAEEDYTYRREMQYDDWAMVRVIWL